MRYLIPVILLTSGCGTECDYTVRGLCFISENFEINEKQVEEVVQLIDEELQVDYSDKKNMSTLLDENFTIVEIVEGDLRWDCSRIGNVYALKNTVSVCDRNISGFFYNGNVWAEKEHFTVTLAHELLHVFEHYELNGAQLDHSLSYRLFEDSVPNLQKDLSVEYRVWLRLPYDG